MYIDETSNLPPGHFASIRRYEPNDVTDILEEDIDDKLPSDIATCGEMSGWAECPYCHYKLRLFYADIYTVKFECDDCGSVFEDNDKEVIWHFPSINLEF